MNMNLISLVKTDNIEDLPKALRALANIVETDIKRMGSSANSIGIFGEIDGVVGDFDYEINISHLSGLSEYIEKNMRYWN